MDVVVSLVSDTFDDVVKRGWYATQDQFLVSCLEHPDVERVVVVDAPRGVVARVYRGMRSRTVVPDRVHRLRPLTLRRTPDVSEAAVMRRYRSLNRQVGRGLRRLQVHRPALVAFNTWHAATGTPGWARTAAFYAMDDESSIAHIASRRADVRHAYARIADSGMPVFAVSDELARRIGVPHRAVTVPNGIDPVLWRHLPAATTAVGTSAPVVSYVGTVDDRLDVEAFASLAAAGFDVRVVGPPRDIAIVDRLAGTPGITVEGFRPRHEVVAALAASDVVVLAHRSTPLTTAMSPLKLFEYVASGRPVVATDLAGMRGQHPSIELVRAGGDYVTAVRAALDRGPLPEAERLAAVESFSWRVRHGRVLALLAGEVGT